MCRRAFLVNRRLEDLFRVNRGFHKLAVDITILVGDFFLAVFALLHYFALIRIHGDALFRELFEGDRLFSVRS